MKTHNAIIYHCLSCGSVVHSDPEAEPPRCCGQAMVKSAAETVNAPETADELGGSHGDIETPVGKARNKPR